MSNPLSNDLIAQFAKAAVGNEEPKPDTALRGTVTRVEPNADDPDKDRVWVKIDGDQIAVDNTYFGTPVSRSTVAISDLSEGDRVELTVKNHAVVITGNVTNGSIGTVTKGELESSITQTAEKITAVVKGINSEASAEMTADEITTTVSNKFTDISTKISQTSDHIEAVVESQEGFSKFQQDVEGFSFMGKGGEVKIQGGDINLTGSITFGDLDETTQDEITTAKDTASSALETANDALVKAEAATLPDYIKSTYISKTEIQSPTIKGTDISVYGTFQTIQLVKTESSDSMTTYEDKPTGYMGAATGMDSEGNTTYGVALASKWDSSSSQVSNSYVIVTDSGVRLQYQDNNLVVSQDGIWINTKPGYTSAFYNDNVIATYPVGSICLRYDHVSPASYVGGSWARISPYFLYAAGANATIGDTGYVSTSTSGNTAMYIKITAWRRIA